MKKTYLLLLLICIGSLQLSATTYTSAANGNWMNVTTWSPFGIPIPGDIIVINHNVTLDTSFAYTTGSITVNAAGSLVQDSPVRDIWVNGPNASYTNAGTTTIRYLLLSDGSFTNSGDFNVKSFANYIVANNNATGVFHGVDSLYNNGTLVNDGTIHVMTFYNDDVIQNGGIIDGLTTVIDSMFNAGDFFNNTGALLLADSCTSTNSFVNNGTVNFDQFTNTGLFNNNNYLSTTDMTNTGTFTNADSLMVAGSMTNTGDFNIQAGALCDMGVSFLNADTVSFNALLTINGTFTIGDSFFNFNNVNGTATGSITVQDTSYNGGTMSGSFDFCDLTPPASSPFIDINPGTVAPTVTYCVGVSVAEEVVNNQLSVYPNPTTGILNIEMDEQFYVVIYNVLGEEIVTTTNNRVDLSAYEAGMYFVLLKDQNGETIQHDMIFKR